MEKPNRPDQYAKKKAQCARLLPTIPLNQVLADKVARICAARNETAAAMVRRLIVEAPEPASHIAPKD